MRRTLVTSGLVAFLACGGGDGSDGGGGDAAAGASLGNASITGAVNFTGTAPANPTIDMSDEAQCAEKWDGAPVDPIVTVADGMLANVFIRVVGGLPAGPYPMPSEPARIDQDGCLYTPRVIGAMVGQSLEITNSDPLLHNIKAVPTANRPFNISQPRVMTTTRRGARAFGTPEIMVPIECNVHGWMNAYIGVVEHSYFAVSGPDGSFTISGLPAGTYQLEAWHETLGTQSGEATVEADGSATVNFTFSG